MRSDKIDWYTSMGTDSFPILCPFHQENTPSCIIWPNKAAFQCIGCGADGYIEGSEDEGEFLVCLEEEL